MKNIDTLKEELRPVVKKAIEDFGLKRFKKLSMFPSGRGGN